MEVQRGDRESGGVKGERVGELCREGRSDEEVREVAKEAGKTDVRNVTVKGSR